jgi:hypothetical protein
MTSEPVIFRAEDGSVWRKMETPEMVCIYDPSGMIKVGAISEARAVYMYHGKGTRMKLEPATEEDR